MSSVAFAFEDIGFETSRYIVWTLCLMQIIASVVCEPGAINWIKKDFLDEDALHVRISTYIYFLSYSICICYA